MSLLPPFPFHLPRSNGAGCHDLSFFLNSFKQAFSLPSFTLIKRFFSSSSLSAIRVASSVYLRLLMFLLPILIPACNSSSPAFLMTCSRGLAAQLCLTLCNPMNCSMPGLPVHHQLLEFVWIMTNCGKLLKRRQYQTILPVS